MNPLIALALALAIAGLTLEQIQKKKERDAEAAKALALQKKKKAKARTTPKPIEEQLDEVNSDEASAASSEHNNGSDNGDNIPVVRATDNTENPNSIGLDTEL